ncbi:Phytochrome-like protein cph2 [Vibrio aerogenes CECT 7868]|uniref:Phytochrome-like protein cph2 n=1 Tax=Vibrio aerogenes CECT 7868 TaxID=1216006 RepID=A0A1M5UVD0_9VIBR|nr:EAL domain-containing protein [Vibrio aerogenes]SHH66909.1 Phytochrome-like protein cph2 [Vibrio aerogenes CECT 7868]
MLRFRSIQMQILLSFLALLITVQCILFYSVYQSNFQAGQEQTQLRLNTARAVLQNQLEERRKFLSDFALTVAKDFGLKQAFSEDAQKFAAALNNHRQRIDADLTLALDKEGNLMTKLIYDKATRETHPEQSTSLLNHGLTRLSSHEQQIFHQSDNTIYQTILVPLKSDTQIIAWIGFGFALDTELARHLALLTGMNVDLAYYHRRSVPPVTPDNTWLLFATSNTQLPAKINHSEHFRPLIEADNPDYVSTWRPVGTMDNKTIVAVLYDSRDDLLATFTKRWFHILLVVVGTFGFSIIAAYKLSKNIAQPLRIFAAKTKQVAQGTCQPILTVNRRDELGVLANEFNLMNCAIAERQQALNFLAYHSDLTHLPNKKKLSEDIDSRIQAGEGPFCLIRFRLAEFIDLNYSLGIDTGDELQIATANMLLRSDQNAQFYQLESAEFAALVPLTESTVSHQPVHLISDNDEVRCHLQHISVTVHRISGFCYYPKHGNTARELVHNAGIALQEALKLNMPSVEFATRMADQAISRVKLINDLSEAIRSSQLALFYQPKLNLKTKQIDKAEALVRWHHPSRGMISPDEFIHIAETTGQINALTDWVLHAAMSQVAQWRQQGINLNVAVNISAINLKQAGFAQKITALFEQYGLPIDAISLEITESTLADDPEYALSVLRHLSEQGLAISIDDYGTGYSSLSQLKNLPASELKIDKAFILNVAENMQDQHIALSTIRLAHQFRLQTVAEGVETQEAIDWLAQHGCEYAQGYHISRPVPADELAVFIRQQNKTFT